MTFQGSKAATRVGGSDEPPQIVRLWSDSKRLIQLARFHGLEQLQQCMTAGKEAWELAHIQQRQIPDGYRVDLPSARVLGTILGVYRSGATLKDDPMLQLELSAEDLADLTGYSKATVEAALRWLSVEPIKCLGMQVARGLGWIHRGRRTAAAYLKGVLQRVFRSSRTVLTTIGRVCIGLNPRKNRSINPTPKTQAQPTPASNPEKDTGGSIEDLRNFMRENRIPRLV